MNTEWCYWHSMHLSTFNIGVDNALVCRSYTLCTLHITGVGLTVPCGARQQTFMHDHCLHVSLTITRTRLTDVDVFHNTLGCNYHAVGLIYFDYELCHSFTKMHMHLSFSFWDSRIFSLCVHRYARKFKVFALHKIYYINCTHLHFFIFYGSTFLVLLVNMNIYLFTWLSWTLLY